MHLLESYSYLLNIVHVAATETRMVTTTNDPAAIATVIVIESP